MVLSYREMCLLLIVFALRSIFENRTEKKSPVQFLATTILGGLIFLVPLVFLPLILGKAFGLMMKVADVRSTVYPPVSPNRWSGITVIASEAQVEYLDTPLSEVIELSEGFGFGKADVLASRVESAPS
jgi:hypothetical protein